MIFRFYVSFPEYSGSLYVAVGILVWLEGSSWIKHVDMLRLSNIRKCSSEYIMGHLPLRWWMIVTVSQLTHRGRTTLYSTSSNQTVARFCHQALQSSKLPTSTIRWPIGFPFTGLPFRLPWWLGQVAGQLVPPDLMPLKMKRRRPWQPEIRRKHQVRLVVYPIIYRVFVCFQQVGFLAINFGSINEAKAKRSKSSRYRSLHLCWCQEQLEDDNSPSPVWAAMMGQGMITYPTWGIQENHHFLKSAGTKGRELCDHVFPNGYIQY